MNWMPKHANTNELPGWNVSIRNAPALCWTNVQVVLSMGLRRQKMVSLFQMLVVLVSITLHSLIVSGFSFSFLPGMPRNPFLESTCDDLTHDVCHLVHGEDCCLQECLSETQAMTTCIHFQVSNLDFSTCTEINCAIEVTEPDVTDPETEEPETDAPETQAPEPAKPETDAPEPAGFGDNGEPPLIGFKPGMEPGDYRLDVLQFGEYDSDDMNEACPTEFSKWATCVVTDCISFLRVCDSVGAVNSGKFFASFV